METILVVHDITREAARMFADNGEAEKLQEMIQRDMLNKGVEDLYKLGLVEFKTEELAVGDRNRISCRINFLTQSDAEDMRSCIADLRRKFPTEEAVLRLASILGSGI